MLIFVQQERKRTEKPLFHPYTDVTLKPEDIHSIGRWLNTDHINAATTLLRKRNPEIGGLCNVEFGITSDYPKAEGNKWPQILFNGANHWLLVAYNFIHKGVAVYDSMPFVNKSLIEANVSSLLRTEKGSFRMKVVPCQDQQNGDDCGVFAIAFATELLHGGNPSQVSFIPSRLRKHLKECYRKGEFSPFPKGGNRQRVNMKVTPIKVNVYCTPTCRRTEKLFRDSNKNEDMAACATCGEWFHRICCSIPPTVFTSKKVTWICPGCKE